MNNNYDNSFVYFLSGHRDITQDEFNKHYNKIDHYLRERLTDDELIKYTFYIGDCSGFDLMAFKHLYENYIDNKALKQIVVCMMDNNECSSNYDYPIHDKIKYVKGFKSHEERDCYMTEHSKYDILWVREGKWDSGTAQNFVRRKFHVKNQ